MKQDLYSLLTDPSDAYLRTRQFRTIHPEAEPCLLEVAPVDVTGAVVQSRYMVLPGDPKVRCRQCRKAHWKANHRKGFVIRLPDGSGLLVGESCGRDHYGAKWKDIQDDFEGKEKRQRLLARRDAILALWPRANREIAEVRKQTWLRGFDVSVRAFQEKLPVLHRLLGEQLTRSGPTLFCEERLRDYARELKRGEEDDSGHSRPAFTTHRIRLGDIRGTHFVLATSPLQATVERMNKDLAVQVDHLNANTNGVSNKALRDGVRTFERSIGTLLEEIGKLSELSKFQERANLLMVCRWAEAQRPDGGRYDVDERGISWIRFDGSVERYIFISVETPILPTLRQLVMEW